MNTTPTAHEIQDPPIVIGPGSFVVQVFDKNPTAPGHMRNRLTETAPADPTNPNDPYKYTHTKSGGQVTLIEFVILPAGTVVDHIPSPLPANWEIRIHYK